jgi:hypothetical protein
VRMAMRVAVAVRMRRQPVVRVLVIMTVLGHGSSSVKSWLSLY